VTVSTTSKTKVPVSHKSPPKFPIRYNKNINKHDSDTLERREIDYTKDGQWLQGFHMRTNLRNLWVEVGISD
jgi:hypothetical protein